MRSVAELLALGSRLDADELYFGEPARVAVAGQLLRIRDRSGRLVPLRANAAQRRFEAQRGRRNIVLKARQMGLTTWVAGQFLLKTITACGVLSVQVAHTRDRKSVV